MQHAIAARHAAKGKLLRGALVTRADTPPRNVGHIAAVLDLAAD